ncbi:cyclin-dependent kinase inhibitor 1-like isoform X2 [Zingiber officinale]|uniref:cyclin-dependent kinase inhibitor 1-like isoform X2 n=1 Tax=Zingiber officinale TaxID=94328 RepID=UPI001C4C7D1D|nr:cyclin-dependent kinase inhibitor 1-like isoform X2 [Zingiber officinale]
MEATGARAAVEGRRRSKRRRRMVMGEEGEIEISSTFFECRSRRGVVVVEPPIARSEAYADRRRRGSGNVCCEALRSGEELDVPKLFLGSKREREEITDSSSDDENQEAGFDLEPTAERDSHRRWPAEAMPTEAELEGFFAAAESESRRRFAERYNFDVVNDAPFAGRFEWIRLAHGDE